MRTAIGLFHLFHSFSVHFRVFLIYFNCFICFCYGEKNVPKKNLRGFCAVSKIYQHFLINSVTIKLRKKEKKSFVYVCGCMHVSIFVHMFVYCVCVCKLQFLAYAILMVSHILHWLFRSCTIFMCIN